jgi:hypothetical protein
MFPVVPARPGGAYCRRAHYLYVRSVTLVQYVFRTAGRTLGFEGAQG